MWPFRALYSSIRTKESFKISTSEAEADEDVASVVLIVIIFGGVIDRREASRTRLSLSFFAGGGLGSPILSEGTSRTLQGGSMAAVATISSSTGTSRWSPPLRFGARLCNTLEVALDFEPPAFERLLESATGSGEEVEQFGQAGVVAYLLGESQIIETSERDSPCTIYNSRSGMTPKLS